MAETSGMWTRSPNFRLAPAYNQKRTIVLFDLKPRDDASAPARRRRLESNPFYVTVNSQELARKPA
jgi:hypothetical protein